MDFIVYLIICLLGFASYTYLRYKGLPPGPYGLPFIGYALFMGKTAKARQDKFAELTKKYGKMFSLNLFNETVVVCNDWASISEVLIKQGNTFSGRPPNFTMDFLFERKELISGDGPIWKEQKRFSTKILQQLGMTKSSMESVIMDQVEDLCAELDKHCGKPTEATHLFFIPMLNVIWGLASGKRFDMSDKSTLAFQKAMADMEETSAQDALLNIIPALRYIVPGLIGYTKLKQAKKIVYDFIKEEVDNHIEKFDPNSTHDFIDCYLAEIKRKNNVPPYTNDHLIFAICILFSAGTETSSTTLTWAILYMALNPEIKKRIQKEMKDAIGENDYLSASSKSQAPYTEATILEVLRITSIVPLSVPHSTMADAVLEGYKIPKGTTILTNIYSFHHDEKLWGDPETFRPERFLDENGQVHRDQRMLAFGTGARVCLGEQLAKTELFLFFTCLMHRFDFDLIPGQPKPSLEPEGGMATYPKPFKVIIQRRN